MRSIVFLLAVRPVFASHSSAALSTSFTRSSNVSNLFCEKILRPFLSSPELKTSIAACKVWRSSSAGSKTLVYGSIYHIPR
ncbi:hypothetical protein BDD12DRAFT_814950 [Trichophaea hybrida]|nr:hypothetical protein BDD12DRAFT_814950 [Trichophaea hybrida]